DAEGTHRGQVGLGGGVVDLIEQDHVAVQQRVHAALGRQRLEGGRDDGRGRLVAPGADDADGRCARVNGCAVLLELVDEFAPVGDQERLHAETDAGVRELGDDGRFTCAGRQDDSGAASFGGPFADNGVVSYELVVA